MKQPELGWTTPVELVRVIDGDTVVVKVTKEITLRLTNDSGDLDAPEIRRPASDEEISVGHYITNELHDFLTDDSPQLVVFIPTTQDGKIQDMFSIGARAVGHLFANGHDAGEFVEELIEEYNVT